MNIPSEILNKYKNTLVIYKLTVVICKRVKNNVLFIYCT